MATPIRHDDLAKGLNGFHSEDKLPDGYWLRLRNFEPQNSGSIRKRTGLQRYGGLVPLRVRSVTRSGSALRLVLQDWIDPSALRSRPIVVAGTTSAAMGSFSTTFTAVAYSSFTASSTYIEVTDTSSGATSEAAPQLNVYGLSIARFDAVADDAGSRAGWVHGLDTFRRQSDGAEWPVCAMEGVLYAGRAHADLDSSLQAEKAPHCRSTADALTILGPAFWAAAPASTPSRGYLVQAEAAAHVVPATAIAYQSDTGWVRFTVNDVSIGSGTLSTILRNGLDWLTVDSAPRALNGTHKIRGAALDGSTLTIDCEIDDVTDDRFDDDGLQAQVAVWTDSIATTDTALPVGAELDVAYATRRQWSSSDVDTANDWVDDSTVHGFHADEAVVYTASGTAIGGLTSGETYFVRLVSGSQTALALSAEPMGDAIDLTGAGSGTHTLTRANPESESWVVQGNSGLRFSIDGVRDLFAIQSGAVIPATYQGRVWCLRTADASATLGVGAIVEGDALDPLGLDNWPASKRPAVANALAGSDLAISQIVGDGSTATATVASTASLSEGDWVRIAGSLECAGEVLVASIESSTTFTFASELDGTDSSSDMVVVGKSAALDDSVELWDDAASSSQTLRPHRRWVAVERPASANSTLIDATTTRHFDYNAADEQPFLRFASLNGSLYIDNGEDEPQKYDGNYLVRSGLPPMQLIAQGGVTREVPAAGGQWINPDLGAELAATSSIVGDVVNLLTSGAGHGFARGDLICWAWDESDTRTEEYPGEVVSDGEDATAVRVTGDLTRLIGGDRPDTFLRRALTFGYYARLNLIDRNGRVTASATTQVSDQVYQAGLNGQTQLRLQRPPAFPGFDHARMEIQLFKRPTTGEPVYNLERTLLVDWDTGAHHTLFQDVGLSTRGIGDSVVDTLIPNGERAPSWELPPRGDAAAAVDGRLVVGAPTSYPRWSIVLRDAIAAGFEGVDRSRVDGSVFYFRRNGATSSTPDQSSVMAFELVSTGNTSRRNSGTVRIEGSDDGTYFDVFDASSSLPSAAVGDWIYLAPADGSASSDDDPTQWNGLSGWLDYFGWFQIDSVETANARWRVAYKNRPRLEVASVDTTADTITFTAAHGIPVEIAVPMSFYGGTLPTGISVRRTYYARATSSTAVEIYENPGVTGSSQVDLTAAGSGTHYGLFGATYYSGVSMPNLTVFWASDKKRVPIPVAFPSPEGAYDGWKTLSFQTIRQPKQYIDALVKWVAHAINSAQAACVSTSGFRPWLFARAGEDFSAGEIFVESPIAESELPTVEFSLPSPAPLTVYVNGTNSTEDTRIAAEVKRLPFRLAVSYRNYPEVFDACFAQEESQSDSAIDLPPLGTGIKVVKSLFGESSSGSSAKSQAVLVATDAAWFVVNVRTKEVQQLATEGRGAPFPRAVAESKNGVAFADYDGVYKINQTLDLAPLGEVLGREWRNVSSSDDIETDIPVATNLKGGHQWQLFYPRADQGEEQRGFSYSYRREAENISSIEAGGSVASLGAWWQLEWAPAVLGAANFARDGLLASDGQRVFSRRRAGDESDYRDDSEAIEATGVYKLLDFGLRGLRKVLRALVACFRTETTQSGTTLSWADSARLAFQAFDDFELEVEGPTFFDEASGDSTTQELQSRAKAIRLSAPNRKGDLMALQIENSALDESCELTGLVFEVDPLSTGGTRQADGEDA